MTACNEIKDIENFAVDHTFEKSVVLDLKANDPNAFFNDFTFETADQQEFKDNLAEISNYAIKTVTYRIADFSGEESITSVGMIQFMEGNNTIGNAIDLGTIQFNSLFNSGETIEIPVSDELKNAIQDNLLNTNSITVRIGGEVSDTPVKAEFVLAIEIEALVNVN